MTDRHLLTNLDTVKRQLGLPSTDEMDDVWLVGAIAAVSEMIETETGRWLAPRPDLALVFDGASSDGYSLRVPRGVNAVTSVGVAFTDQPDDGSGDYTTLSDTPRIRGRVGALAAGSVIEFARDVLPTTGYARIKVAGDFGEPETPERVSELATIAVVRSFLARRDGGAADLAITGLNGGRTILRRLSPSETAELRRSYGSTVVLVGSTSVA